MPSFLNLLTSCAQTAYSFLARRQRIVMTQSALDTFGSRSLSAEESFGLEDGMYKGDSETRTRPFALGVIESQYLLVGLAGRLKFTKLRILRLYGR